MMPFVVPANLLESTVVLPVYREEYAIWPDRAVTFRMTVDDTVPTPPHDGLLNNRTTLRISSTDMDIVEHGERGVSDPPRR